MNIVYNCGYRNIVKIKGKSGKIYTFKKRYTTEVLDEDAADILSMTAQDIQWCPKHDKNIPPFMELTRWCRADTGRFEYGNNQPEKYNPEQYLRLFKQKQ